MSKKYIQHIFKRKHNLHFKIILSFILLFGLSTFVFSQDFPFTGSNGTAIESPGGLTLEKTSYLGDTIHLNTYYRNENSSETDIIAGCELHTDMTFIESSPDGDYDETADTVLWRVESVPVAEFGSISFSVTTQSTGSFVIATYMYFGDSADISSFSDLKDMGQKCNDVLVEIEEKPDTGWMELDTSKPFSPANYAKIQLKEETTTSIMLNFDIPGIKIYEAGEAGETYHRLEIPGYASGDPAGNPELPIIGQVVEVPFEVEDFEVEIYKSEYEVFDNYTIYPMQDPYNHQDDKKEFTVNQEVYGTDALYPGNLSTIENGDIVIMRGHRILFIKVNPVQYNPVTRELRVYSNVEIKINYSNPGQIRAIDERLYSPAYEKVLGHVVINYKDRNRLVHHPTATPRPMPTPTPEDTGPIILSEMNLQDYRSLYENGCDYLIIVHEDMYNPNNLNDAVFLFRDWKQQKGLETLITEVQNIPDSDSSTTIDEVDIKAYIQNIYDTWNPPPTFILLIGDAGDNSGNILIPTFYVSQDPSHNNTLRAADLYYVTVDGPDTYPDIFLGRISVDTPAQTADILNKIIEYEKNPPGAADAAFYDNSSVIALFEDTDDNGIEDRPWIETAEDIRECLVTEGYTVERIYNTSGTVNPTTYNDGVTAIPAAIQPPGFQWNGGAGDISAAIGAGRFLLTYRDHGDRHDWSEPNFDTTDIGNLANGDLTPVILSLACRTGWFDNESDDDLSQGLVTADNSECFAEEFLRHNNGGTVAIVASTRNSKTGYNDFLALGMIKAIWENYNPTPGYSASYPDIPDITTGSLSKMGQIMNFGKVFMANAYADSANRLENFEEYLLFGDPEMDIRTQLPGTLDVEHPEGLGMSGTQEFIVSVQDTGTDVRGAIVAITKDDELYAAEQTNALGNAHFTIWLSESGTYTITVSAMNYRPYEGEITVVDGGAQITLDPYNGTTGQTILVEGSDFSGSEDVDIFFGDTLVATLTASGGIIASSGSNSFTVPASADLGVVNITAEGQTSGRWAVQTFTVRDENPVELYTYDQHAESTWHLYTGDNPTWNSPSIWIQDSSSNNVNSADLTTDEQYTIYARIYNSSGFDADSTIITFKWGLYGAGQVVWNEIDTDVIDVDANDYADAEILWAPQTTGHVCIRVFIDHIEDIDTSDNEGQENCTVQGTASPAVVGFHIWNMSDEPGEYFLELRQQNRSINDIFQDLWQTNIIQPDPQWLEPGEHGNVQVVLDPADLNLLPGDSAEFSLTAYINGIVAGGINCIANVTNKLENSCIFGSSLVLIEQAAVSADIGSNDSVVIGVDSSITGHITSAGSAYLRKRAFIDGDVTVKDSIITQDYVTITGSKIEGVNIDPRFISSHTVSYGSTNVEVGPPDHSTYEVIYPGAYNKIVVHKQCTLELSPGVYDINIMEICPDAKLLVNGPVTLNIESRYSFGDRAVLSGITFASDFSVYMNQNKQVFIGSESRYTGHITAPSTDVVIKSKAYFTGCIAANRVYVKPDATINSTGMALPNEPGNDGDVNADGIIDIVDALLIAQSSVNLIDPLPLEVADTNCDGVIDVVDALLVAQYFINMITEFCYK